MKGKHMSKESSNDMVLSGREEEISRLLETFEVHEKALFRFLVHLAQLEKDSQDKPVDTVVPLIGWNFGYTTQDLLHMAVDNQTFPLSDLNNHYDVMSWQYGINTKHPDYHSYIKNIDEESVYKFLDKKHGGSSDVRIIHYGVDQQRKALRFFANMGSLKGMEEDFKKAFDNESYPVFCEDRSGFHYENPAYSALHVQE